MQQQKSRAFYRIQATRMMIGAGNILKKHAADQARKVSRTGPALTHDTHRLGPDILVCFPLLICFRW